MNEPGWLGNAVKHHDPYAVREPRGARRDPQRVRGRGLPVRRAAPGVGAGSDPPGRGRLRQTPGPGFRGRVAMARRNVPGTVLLPAL
jgi:hypothetical protein